MITSSVHAEHFPNGGGVIPPLLTPGETIQLLRLDVVTKTDGTEELRAIGDALRSLERLVSQKKLRPLKLGKSRTYARHEVLELISSGSEAGG